MTTASNQSPAVHVASAVPALPTLEKYDLLLMHARRWDSFTVCPPEWDMSPVEYRRTVSRCAPGLSSTTFLSYMGLFPSLVGVVIGGLSIYRGTEQASSPWALMAFVLTGLAFAGFLIHNTRTKRKAQRRVERLDPRHAVVLTTGEARKAILAMAAPLTVPDEKQESATMPAVLAPDERARVLGDLYAEATRLSAIEKGAKAAQKATAAASAAEAASQIADEHAERKRRWHQTLSRFEAIDTAWADLLIDPLSVLDHALLLDVTNVATAHLIEAHGHARDLIGTRTADDLPPTSTLTETETAVRALDTAWTEARTRAERAGYDWLPEADRKRARQATALLDTAADESLPLAARANAGAKAVELLNAIEAITVPRTTMLALTEHTRLALTAPVAV